MIHLADWPLTAEGANPDMLILRGHNVQLAVACLMRVLQGTIGLALLTGVLLCRLDLPISNRALALPLAQVMGVRDRHKRRIDRGVFELADVLLDEVSVLGQPEHAADVVALVFPHRGVEQSTSQISELRQARSKKQSGPATAGSAWLFPGWRSVDT